MAGLRSSGSGGEDTNRMAVWLTLKWIILQKGRRWKKPAERNEPSNLRKEGTGGCYLPWAQHDSAIDGAFCAIHEKWGKPPSQVRGTRGYMSHVELGKRPGEKCKSMPSPTDTRRQVC